MTDALRESLGDKQTQLAQTACKLRRLRAVSYLCMFVSAAALTVALVGGERAFFSGALVGLIVSLLLLARFEMVRKVGAEQYIDLVHALGDALRPGVAQGRGALAAANGSRAHQSIERFFSASTMPPFQARVGAAWFIVLVVLLAAVAVVPQF